MWSEYSDAGSREARGRRSGQAFTEFDLVVLTADRPEAGLRAGDVGTVLSVVGSGFHVDFSTPGGASGGVLILSASDLRAVGPDEVFHVRPLDRPVPPPLRPPWRVRRPIS